MWKCIKNKISNYISNKLLNSFAKWQEECYLEEEIHYDLYKKLLKDKTLETFSPHEWYKLFNINVSSM